ncbi:MAG: hypothetical protein PHD13_02965, partial [Methanocellales archaeon]|nr:hypothetical protein [Methanocellales archaeon]MDD3291770.1 hypothetical protein [Methanocellales archaeon]MDD5235120.1 hypothetical protein [Methanocellales archaeon]MDD5485258.1 hypothetical protein [Methanocellales archaeon]
MNKKICLVVVALVFLSMMVSVNGQTAPILTVSHHTIPETLRPGSEFGLSIDIMNVGTGPAQGISVSIAEYNSDLDVITETNTVSSGDVVHIGDLSPGSGTATFRLKAHNSGLYEVRVSVSYTYYLNVSGILMSQTGIINERILLSVSEESDFVLSNSSFSSSIEPGKSVTATFKLKNIGEGVEDVMVGLQASEAISTIGPTEKYVGKWESNEEKTITYEIYVDSRASTGVHELSLLTTYEDKYHVKRTDTISTGVDVKGIPEVDISDFVLSNSSFSSSIEPGKSVTATFKLKNIGEGVEDVMVGLQA